MRRILAGFWSGAGGRFSENLGRNPSCGKLRTFTQRRGRYNRQETMPAGDRRRSCHAEPRTVVLCRSASRPLRLGPQEGKRIGQRSDSKSDAGKPVVGSNPMPSASKPACESRKRAFCLYLRQIAEEPRGRASGKVRACRISRDKGVGDGTFGATKRKESSRRRNYSDSARPFPFRARCAADGVASGRRGTIDRPVARSRQGRQQGDRHFARSRRRRGRRQGGRDAPGANDEGDNSSPKEHRFKSSRRGTVGPRSTCDGVLRRRSRSHRFRAN